MFTFMLLCIPVLDDAAPGWFQDGWDPIQVPFTGQPGPTELAGELDADSEPLKFLQLYLTDELLQLLADETNNYAKQCINEVCVFFVYSPDCCCSKLTL